MLLQTISSLSVISEVVMKYCIWWIVCLIVAQSLSLAQARSFDDFVPKTESFLLDTINENLGCANEKLSQHAHLKPNTITVGAFKNNSGDSSIPTGISGLVETSIFKIIKNTKLNLLKHNIQLVKGFAEIHKKSKSGYFISGQISGFDKAAVGSGFSAGLFTQFFSIGNADNAMKSLMQIDYLLTDGMTGFVEETVSLGTVLEYLDKTTKNSGHHKSNGFYISWSDDAEESIALAQRIISAQASLILLEKVAGMSLTCDKKRLRSVNSSNTEVIEVVANNFYIPKVDKEEYFPPTFRARIRCKGHRTVRCEIKHKKMVNKDIIAYAERALLDSVDPRADVYAECGAKRGKLVCILEGDVGTFNKNDLRDNLYG